MQKTHTQYRKLMEVMYQYSLHKHVDFLDYTLYPDFEHFKVANKGRYICFSRYGLKSFGEFKYHENDEDIYLIFGKESTGIPKEILKEHLDMCFRIPMNSNIRALNLSNSVAIVLFEVLRQLDYPNLSRVETFKGEDYLTQ